MIIGIISDTHGLLTSGALKALAGADRIVHAGDIDGPDVLKILARIAPVTAVRGNMDQGHWAQALPVSDLVAFNGTHFYTLHNLDKLDLDPMGAGIQVVISGHTHQPEIKIIQGVLYFNPGSASYGRHGGSLSVGRIEVTADGVHPRIIGLNE
jgi:uncharacterized protein